MNDSVRTAGASPLVFAFLVIALTACAGPDVRAGREAYEIGDFETALVHFRIPAERGDAEAQLYLGLMYRGGQGIPVDQHEAVRWYRRAAEQGHPRAQTNLAISYALGRGLEKDARQALHWYLRAARQGYTDAQVRLGELYTGGQGISPDPIKAYAWYSMALMDETTCECVRGYRDETAAAMSSEQIKQAEQMVEEWAR